MRKHTLIHTRTKTKRQRQRDSDTNKRRPSGKRRKEIWGKTHFKKNPYGSEGRTIARIDSVEIKSFDTSGPQISTCVVRTV